MTKRPKVSHVTWHRQDDGLRTKLAVALMRALQDGSLQQHLDKAPRWAAFVVMDQKL
jgi:hypothetical protein